MLQIYIEHFKNETVVIQSIQDDDKILSEYGDNEINLNVCIPFINEEIKVHHQYVEDTKSNYTLTAKLLSVEIESLTQCKCIRYLPISK